MITTPLSSNCTSSRTKHALFSHVHPPLLHSPQHHPHPPAHRPPEGPIIPHTALLKEEFIFIFVFASVHEFHEQSTETAPQGELEKLVRWQFVDEADEKTLQAETPDHRLEENTSDATTAEQHDGPERVERKVVKMPGGLLRVVETGHLVEVNISGKREDKCERAIFIG